MEEIYNLIQENPGFFAWVFAIMNILWGAFLYFNRKRHDKELKKLQYSLDLDLERRKRIFDLKASQYERYTGMLDEFGRKYQTNLYDRMESIFKKLLSSIMSSNDEKSKREAIMAFSVDTMNLMNEMSADYYKIKSESKSLRLTASDSLIQIFEELESLVQASIDSAQNFMKQLPNLIVSNNQKEIDRNLKIFNTQGQSIQMKSCDLERQMRVELKEF